MPDKEIMYIPAGKFVEEKGTIEDLYTHYIICIRYATEERTGMSFKPTGPSGPWIGGPGTQRAHTMVNPPTKLLHYNWPENDVYSPIQASTLPGTIVKNGIVLTKVPNLNLVLLEIK